MPVVGGKTEAYVPTAPATDTRHGFDITVETVIGRVTIGDGEVSAYVAAMNVIARHGDAGTYRFPDADGLAEVIIMRGPHADFDPHR